MSPTLPTKPYESIRAAIVESNWPDNAIHPGVNARAATDSTRNAKRTETIQDIERWVDAQANIASIGRDDGRDPESRSGQGLARDRHVCNGLTAGIQPKNLDPEGDQSESGRCFGEPYHITPRLRL